ncbi:MAG: nicotinamide-nucleotide amidohydrolase family protein [Thauera sp.]|jgi:nicotinamide-nucleotide amidase|nr:nicotinamide-nucleotide amidohydrolase family protein [Thauera sp.]
MNPELDCLASSLGEALLQRGWQLATAESCTGGWIACAVTTVAGSSAWFERGFVTYSNEAKQDLLGVRSITLEQAGAVSAACVEEMALGALAHSKAMLSVAVSGIAGPGGGSAHKPVGTVFLAWALRDGGVRSTACHFSGDRQQVRLAAVRTALDELIRIAAAGRC